MQKYVVNQSIRLILQWYFSFGAGIKDYIHVRTVNTYLTYSNSLTTLMIIIKFIKSTSAIYNCKNYRFNWCKIKFKFLPQHIPHSTFTFVCTVRSLLYVQYVHFCKFSTFTFISTYLRHVRHEIIGDTVGVLSD